MDKTLYIKYLEDTSKKVFPVILQEINDTIDNEIELEKILSFFYSKRADKLLLKPTLFRLSYELCGGNDFEKFIPLAAAFEVLNISSYQANTAFDNKLGVLSKEEKDNQFIASMLSREFADRFLYQLKNVTDTQPLYQCISKSNLFIYKAQHYDLNLLSLSNSQKCQKYEQNKTVFLQDYHNRCYFGSGVFSGQTALAGAIVAGANTEQQKALQSFGEIYGTALHKINDLADFFPGEERQGKVYQDDFCDIHNGRLTFPVYELRTKYSQDYDMIMSLLEKDTIQTEAISNILIQTDIIDNVQKTAKEAFVKAKECLGIFETTDSKRMLITLLSILDSNKFYHRAKTEQNGK